MCAGVAVVRSGALRAAGESVRSVLAEAGFEIVVVEAPDGEAAKQLAVAGHAWAVLGRAGFARSDAIVSVGGGDD